MLTMVKLLVLALSIAVTSARPQEDVEAVTSLEALLEDTSLEAGDIQLDADQGIIDFKKVPCIFFLHISRWFSVA